MNRLLAVFLLLPSIVFAQATLNGVPNQTSSGIQYDNASSYAFFGDSLLMVSTTNSSSALKLSSTVTASACDGTNCTITDATGVGAAFYRVGMWLMPGADTLLGFSPSCLAVSRVQVKSIVGNVISFSEAQTIIPAGTGGTHGTGCTGTQSGTGGTVQDASNFTPYQWYALNYASHNGQSTTPIYNRAWPGQSIADLAAHLTGAGYMTGLPSGSYVFVQSNDFCGTNNATTFISDLQTIATAIHAAGHLAFISTAPIGPTYNCGFGVTGDATAFAVNQWIQTGAQCPISTTATNCWDGVIDQITYGVNDRTDANTVNQSGSLAGHLTDLGNRKSAEAYNDALVKKLSSNTNGLAGVHAVNQFTQLQYLYGGWQMTNGTNFENISGQDNILNYGWWNSSNHNYFNLNNGSSFCSAQTGGQNSNAAPHVCLSASSSFPGYFSIGVGTFPSTTTTPTPGDSTGGLDQSNGTVFAKLLGLKNSFTSDPTCNSGDYQLFSNSTAHVIKACQNGTITALPSAGFANPMTTLGDVIYGGASGTPTRLAGPTTTAHTFVLSDVPSGGLAVAPVWTDLATYLASPPAIGGTTPAAGTFTSLQTGTGSSACGSATGCISLAEASTAGTPTAGNDYIRADSVSHALLASLNGAAEAPLAVRLPVGNVTFTPGTGVTSVACATSYTCTNARGEFTLVGGTATTGTIATVNFSTTLGAAPFCVVSTNGNGGSSTTFFDLGHGLPSTSSFTVTSGITVIGATINIDYQCAQ